MAPILNGIKSIYKETSKTFLEKCASCNFIFSGNGIDSSPNYKHELKGKERLCVCLYVNIWLQNQLRMVQNLTSCSSSMQRIELWPPAALETLYPIPNKRTRTYLVLELWTHSQSQGSIAQEDLVLTPFTINGQILRSSN